MNNLIDTLNHTSAMRTLFYCLVFLAALAIVADGISSAIQAFRRKP